MAAAALAIRARSTGLVAGDLAAAVAERSVAVTWSLRGTRHLHAAEDVGWIRSLMEPVFNRPSARDRELGIAGAAGERGIAALRRALETEGVLTRAQAKEVLAQAGIDVSGQAPIHLLARAALEGLLVVVPTPGASPATDRYAQADGWLPPAAPVEADRALTWLAERYLAAYGPAAPGDLVAWAGLPRGLVRHAWAGAADRLVEVEVEGQPGRLWMLRSRAPAPARAEPPAQGPAPQQQAAAARTAAEGEAPLRLAGAFDPFLLGYADRSLHLAPEFARRYHPGGGILRPVVLAGGRVAGTWALRRRPFAVTVSPFGDLELNADDLARETADVERFLA